MLARLQIALTLTLSLGLAAHAADTVTLTNGDTITGSLTAQTDEHVVLQHPQLGELKIPRAQVAGIETAAVEPDPAEADAPDALAEAAALLTEAGYTVEPPDQAGPSPEQIQEAESLLTDEGYVIDPPPGASPSPKQVDRAQSMLSTQGFTVEPPAEEAPPNPALKIGPLRLLEGWERRFEVGINGSEGNTENLSARVALDFFYEDAERRWLIDSAYFTKRESGDTTENEFYAQATRDWLLPDKKHFYFLTGRYDWDEFQD